MRKFFVGTFLIFVLAFVGSIAVFGQNTERSQLIEYVEEQISSPSYQIRLNGLEGALSSDVKLESITIADEEGVWLRILKPHLIWTRTALLRGRLQVNSLTADKVEVLRKPKEDTTVSPEASSFAIPELPVAVLLEKLEIKRVEFGEDVFDLASAASVEGSINLDTGRLEVGLDVNRLDGPAGSLKADIDYDQPSERIALDIKLIEPQNGIAASVLGLEGKPPVSLTLVGDAPIDELDLTMAFDVASERILDGDIKFRGDDNALRADANVEGPLSQILPVKHREFFGSNSKLSASLVFPEEGGLKIDRSSLDSGVLKLLATGSTTRDGFLEKLDLNFNISDRLGAPINLPVSDGSNSIASANLSINYAPERSNSWDAKLSVNDFRSDELSVRNIIMVTEGEVQNFNQPSERGVSFLTKGSAQGISSKDPAIFNALGSNVNFNSKGRWKTGSPLMLDAFEVFNNAFNLRLTGEIADMMFDGNVRLQSEKLAAFSSLSGVNLGGGVNFEANGKIMPLTGAFDLDVMGEGNNLTLDNDKIDRLLAGDTKLTGGVARGENGLILRDLKLVNQQISASVNGQLASKNASMSANAFIEDLAIIDQNSSGRLEVRSEISGEQKHFKLVSSIALPKGKLASQKVENIALIFTGLLDDNVVLGEVSSNGFIDSQALDVTAKVNLASDIISVDNIVAQIGQTRLLGRFARVENGQMDANIEVASNDISSIAALALKDAKGSLAGTIILKPSGETGQTGDVELTAQDIVFDQHRVSSADIKATVDDLLEAPKVNAQIKALGITSSGIQIQGFDTTLETNGNLTKFNANATMKQYAANMDVSGSIEQNTANRTIILEKLSLNSNIADARLREPTTITMKGDVINFPGANIAVGNGSVLLSGSSGKSLDITSKLASIPLSLLNAFAPDLEASGEINGQAIISGSPQKPAVNFDLNGQAVSMRAIADAGLQPLAISTNGRFENNVIQLQNATARNAQNLDINGSGNIPLKGNGLAIQINGTAPLSIVEPLLEERGATLSGVVNIAANISGSIDNPQTSGSVTINDATLVDPLSNLKLTNLDLSANLDQPNTALVRMSANIASGGSVSANGTLGLTNGMPANIDILLNSVKYGDGQTFNTTASGNLNLSGSLAVSPLLAGTVNLDKTDISIPENFSSQSGLLDVTHVSPSGKTNETLNRIKLAHGNSSSGGGSGTLRLEVRINAPNQIFVRGRGLDAELGGQVTLLGPITNISPIGGFTLKRGRLSILGQRLDLQEGIITLAGDLDPLLNFLASTQSGDTTAFIRLQGKASNLEVSFSAEPELPEDEVLSQIIFGRGISDLSPTQIARLASIANELTGGNSPSLIDDLRESTGLDDIDVVQDGDGNAAVKAGKYISDNVYLGIQAGQETEATINLDITESLKARGSVNSQGESKIGVFFEKDY